MRGDVVPAGGIFKPCSSTCNFTEPGHTFAKVDDWKSGSHKAGWKSGSHKADWKSGSFMSTGEPNSKPVDQHTNHWASMPSSNINFSKWNVTISKWKYYKRLSYFWHVTISQ